MKDIGHNIIINILNELLNKSVNDELQNVNFSMPMILILLFLKYGKREWKEMEGIKGNTLWFVCYNTQSLCL